MADIFNLAKKHNGIISAKIANANNISNASLKYFAEKGELEKVARGVYILPENFEDEFFGMQNRFSKGIFSLESALYFLNLSDRTPSQISMTFPYSYNLTNPKSANIKCSQVKPEVYALGIKKIKTPFGNEVNCYNTERTLCDILKVSNHVDIQLVTSAFKTYAKSKEKNIPLLSDYAKIIKVEKKLSSYLEVLL